MKNRKEYRKPVDCHWHTSADSTILATSLFPSSPEESTQVHTGGTKYQVLTTMTRMTGPAKLQMRGSWMEIQQKSGFP
jgi:hypothetical protein